MSVKLAACRVWLNLCLYNCKIPSWKVKDSINILFCFFPSKMLNSWFCSIFLIKLTTTTSWSGITGICPWNLLRFLLFPFKCSFADFFFLPGLFLGFYNNPCDLWEHCPKVFHGSQGSLIKHIPSVLKEITLFSDYHNFFISQFLLKLIPSVCLRISVGGKCNYINILFSEK